MEIFTSRRIPDAVSLQGQMLNVDSIREKVAPSRQWFATLASHFSPMTKRPPNRGDYDVVVEHVDQ